MCVWMGGARGAYGGVGVGAYARGCVSMCMWVGGGEGGVCRCSCVRAWVRVHVRVGGVIACVYTSTER